MSLKIEFVERAAAGEKIAPLCREYGISRTAGHKWIKRFEEKGYEGLEDESRKPKSAPLATAEDIVIAVIAAREKHSRWGPIKLHDFLAKKFGGQTPSARTIARILRRADKVRKRRGRATVSVVEHAPSVVANAPNDVWTADFKGWWRLLDGTRCEPLTVRDAASRFVLAIVATKTTSLAVRTVFERLFARHGVPGAIQTDNGTPFISVRARGGLTELSAWWVALGIKIVRSRPGCPQDNGAHERMHADVSAEVQVDPAQDLAEQQRRLDKWRQDFNHVRPHQALDGKTPAEVYKVAERRKPVVQRFTYAPKCHVRRVDSAGFIRFRSEPCYVGSGFAGHLVGLEVIDAFRARVWFRDVDLGAIETAPGVEDTFFLPTLKQASAQ